MRNNPWWFVIGLSFLFGSDSYALENLSLAITAHIQDVGDRSGGNSQELGVAGKRLELINIKKASGPKNVKIQYRCVTKDSGETAWLEDGQDCGTRGQGKALTGFAARLAGEGAQNYKLYYSCRGANFLQTSPSHAYCGYKVSNEVNLETLTINVQPTSEDQGYSDDTIRVMAFRLKLADPPKVAFMAWVYGELAKFNIEYQPKDASLPLNRTPDVAVGGTDGRRYADGMDKYGYFGDSLGRKNELLSEALVPNTEYVYRLVGKYKDGKEYKSPDLTFKTMPLPGLKMGLLTDQASQRGISSLNFAGAIGKAKDDGVAYIEYGVNPTKLDQKTKEKSFNKGEDVWYATIADLVQPGATYYYRLAADYREGDTAQGNTLSIKAKDIAINPENPCFPPIKPMPSDATIRLSEDLVVVCKGYDVGPSVSHDLIHKGGNVDDRLVCPEQFPRNLNTKSFDFKIPKTEIGLSLEQAGPGFWRSSEDLRFNDWKIWAKKGYEGQQQPVRQGTQNYSAINWNPKPQTMITWIYCSKNWSAPNTFK